MKTAIESEFSFIAAPAPYPGLIAYPIRTVDACLLACLPGAVDPKTGGGAMDELKEVEEELDEKDKEGHDGEGSAAADLEAGTGKEKSLPLLTRLRPYFVRLQFIFR